MAKKKEQPEEEKVLSAEEPPKANAEKPADNPAPAEKPAEDAAPSAAAEAEARLLAEKDKYLRLAAEYDNFRKRSQKEREALYSDIRCDTILKLLPVYDNLARALQHQTADQAFYKGVELTMAQLKSILEKMGVTEIDTVGQKFDPALHNAVMHVEDEQYGENEIVEEFEKGFRLGDRVIRFAVVKVAN